MLKALNDAATVGRHLQQSRRHPDAPRAATESGRPTYFLTKAAEAEPDDPDILFNLGYAYALDRDPQGAIYWLREALRRNPADGDAHVVLAAALDSSGSTVEAARERELAAQLSTEHADLATRPDRLPRGLERDPPGHGPGARQPDRPRDHEHRPAGSARARAVSPRTRAGGCTKPNRIARRRPSCAARCSCRRTKRKRSCCSGASTCAAGRPQDAVAALKISIWSRDTAAGAGRARGRVPAAQGHRGRRRLHVQKALALDPNRPRRRRC